MAKAAAGTKATTSATTNETAARKAGKRLALFLDGTWATRESNTNIWRLSTLCAEQGAEGVRQLNYYDPGVGTKIGTRLIGGALGFGLGDNIAEAYRWLMTNYNDGDEVFVFGYSRGAFTARSLVGFLSRCGLMEPGSPLSVTQLYERYAKGGVKTPLYTLRHWRRNGKKDANGVLQPWTPTDREDALVLQYGRRIEIAFVGVFDTVGSLGVPFGDVPGLSSSSFKFHTTTPSRIMKVGRQALAIDEHRKAFAPTLWTKFMPDQPDPGETEKDWDIEQRWFVGAHGNVGGGVGDDLLAQVPLAWMVGEATKAGLTFKRAIQVGPQDHLGRIEDPFSSFIFGLYAASQLWQRHYRVIGADRRRVTGGTSMPINETIDATVFDRVRQGGSVAPDAAPLYYPPGLVTWEKRKGLDAADVVGTVDAVTPKSS